MFSTIRARAVFVSVSCSLLVLVLVMASSGFKKEDFASPLPSPLPPAPDAPTSGGLNSPVAPQLPKLPPLPEIPNVLRPDENVLTPTQPAPPAPPAGTTGPGPIAAATDTNEIRVNSEKKVILGLISAEEADDEDYGWWNAWEAQKNATAPIQSPHVFKDLKPGVYTLIAYDSASIDYDPNNGNPAEQSDGVLMEEVTITATCKLSYSLKMSDFKDWNCLSCPWLYVDSGNGYVRTTEVLKDVVGRENQTTTSFALDDSAALDGIIKIRLQEEKDEITYLDRCLISIGGVEVAAEATYPAAARALSSADGDHLILKKGESIDLQFTLPNDRAANSSIVLETTGFYEPDKAFLDAIYKEYTGGTSVGN